MSWTCIECNNINEDSEKLCSKCGELNRILKPDDAEEQTAAAKHLVVEIRDCRDIASVLRRLIAFLIDVLIIGGVCLLVDKALFNIKFERNLLRVVFLIIIYIYMFVLEGLSTQGTLGKIIIGISVNNKAGQKISLLKSCIRNLIKLTLLGEALLIWDKSPLISIAILCAVYCSMFLLDKKQAVYDFASGTVVTNRGL